MGEAIEVRDNPDESRFEATVDGALAVAEYQLDGGAMLFTHTHVPPELEGQGVASALIRAALAAARERGLKVVPHCSFVAAYMKRHRDTQDLLADR